ncbi:MAG TPA: hypothetical protein VF407_03570 [Polyangiaceae bacterium]
MSLPRTSPFLFLAPVAFGIALAAAAPFVPRVAHADDACGTKENPCPLQKWMRQNMAPAMAAGDNAGLAAALDKVAATNPDASWSTWSSISKQGADAARKGDTAGVKASCKGCHDAYKDKYKTQYRMKAPPK